MLALTVESARLADAFLHVWQTHVPNNGTGRESAVEVELIGSHTSDPSHLDPSCRACHRLRSALLSIAQEAVQRVASTVSAGITFDVYADPACIVCSSGDGQRPWVTVSIYVGSRSDSAAQNGFPAAVGQIRQALGALGIRER